MLLRVVRVFWVICKHVAKVFFLGCFGLFWTYDAKRPGRVSRLFWGLCLCCIRFSRLLWVIFKYVAKGLLIC